MDRPETLLTIGVPTFNRVASIRRRLAELAGVLGGDVAGLVIDNASQDGTWEELEAAARRVRDLRVLRNDANLGCDRNYLRLVREARSRWVWLLGDDEQVDWTKLPRLLDLLRSEREAGLVHLPSPFVTWPEAAPVAFGDVGELLAGYPSWLGFAHLSSNVLRVDVARAHLGAGEKAVGTLHSYVPLSLGCVATGGMRVLKERILTGATGRAPRWRMLEGMVGAWEATRLGVPGRWRREARRLEAKARGHVIVRSAVDDLLGLSQPWLTWGRFLRIARLLPLSQKAQLVRVGLAAASWAWPRAGAAVFAARLESRSSRGLADRHQDLAAGSTGALVDTLATRIEGRRRAVVPAAGDY